MALPAQVESDLTADVQSRSQTGAGEQREVLLPIDRQQQPFEAAEEQACVAWHAMLLAGASLGAADDVAWHAQEDAGEREAERLAAEVAWTAHNTFNEESHEVEQDAEEQHVSLPVQHVVITDEVDLKQQEEPHASDPEICEMAHEEENLVLIEQQRPAEQELSTDTVASISMGQCEENEDDAVKAPPCKRRRIGEQGEATDGAASPRPKLCRLQSRVFQEEIPSTECTSFQKVRRVDISRLASQFALSQSATVSQRLVAPVKRLYSWLQDSWESRVNRGRRVGPVGEAPSIPGTNLDTCAKQQHQQPSVAGNAAVFGA